MARRPGGREAPGDPAAGRAGKGGAGPAAGGAEPDREKQARPLAVSGILLAAGESRRMGRPKQLLRYRGETLLRRAAREAAASRLAEVIVVLGHHADRCRVELEGLPVRVVENPAYRQGMSSSLRRGLEAASGQAEAALFLLVDQPRADARLIDRILEAFARQRPEAVVPTAGERPGNPVLVARRHFPALMALEGDVGGRPVVRRLGAGVLQLPVPEEALEDLDVPTDLERLAPEARQGGIADPGSAS